MLSQGFDLHIGQNILSLRFGHEKISMAILSLPWIKEGQCQLLAKEGPLILVNCLGGC